MKGKIPLLILFVVIITLFFGEFLPLSIKQLLFSLSLSIKNLLLFVLPFIIYALLLNSMIKLQTGSILMIGTIFAVVCLSNFIATFISFFIGTFTVQHATFVEHVLITKQLLPLWELKLPKLIANETAVLFGILTGILFTKEKFNKFGKNFALILEKYATFVLRKLFIPILPVFICGFILKMQEEDILKDILGGYLQVFAMISLGQLSYILLLYAIAAKFKFTLWFSYIRSMLPAGVTGFTTMSSVASMPLTLKATEINTCDREFSQLTIPLTVNIHLLGDCIAIPVLAFAILSHFSLPSPDIHTYLLFTLFFVISKFAVAAVPGGGVLVMLPVLEKYLGLSSEMLSLITAMYIIFDSFITMVNIMGNGAFAILLNKFIKFLRGVNANQFST